MTRTRKEPFRSQYRVTDIWLSQLQNPAEPLRNDEPQSLYVRHNGFCTRCEQPLGDEAWMVREKVIACIIGPPDDTLALHDDCWVPVCLRCLTPKEAIKEMRQRICGGCGLRMNVPFWKAEYKFDVDKDEWRGRFCSKRCQKRVRRARRRAMRRAYCCQCGITFKPTRRDARYCSPACRQSAFRKRVRGDEVPKAEAAE